MTDALRIDNRRPDELRDVAFRTNIAPNASGSVLVSFGKTQVICAAMLEPKVPSWMKAEGRAGGWITAEYAMLPYSTLERKQRDTAKGKQDGRSVEIQRLIGRSLRAAFDLTKLDGYTLWLDCDVLQADGGTRTAAITGAWVAARIAVNQLIKSGGLKEDPIVAQVAAISVGIVKGTPMLDLCYHEDKDAEVDANVVMTDAGHFVEVQGTGESSTYTRGQLNELLDLAHNGIARLMNLQSLATMPA